MLHIDTYRITTDRWRRTWQAEWVGCPCSRAARAWTERGVIRKATRWANRELNQAMSGGGI